MLKVCRIRKVMDFAAEKVGLLYHAIFVVYLYCYSVFLSKTKDS